MSSDDENPPSAGGVSVTLRRLDGAEEEPPNRDDTLQDVYQEQPQRLPYDDDDDDDDDDRGQGGDGGDIVVDDGEGGGDEGSADEGDGDGDEGEAAVASVVPNRLVWGEEQPHGSGYVSLQQAAGIFRVDEWNLMNSLGVRFPPPDSAAFPEPPQRYRDHLRDLSSELERHRSIREIRLGHGHWPHDANDVDSLGRELERYLQLLTEGIASNPISTLTALRFLSTRISVDHARLIKAILEQDHVPIRDLRLCYCNLGSDGLRLVCEGAGMSRHLQILSFRDELDVLPGAVVSVVGPNTPLRHLAVRARSWAPQALEELVKALRVNTKLVHAFLGQRGRFRQASLVEDFVRTYNFNIRSVVLDPQNEDGSFQDGTDQGGPIGALLRRNHRVRDVHASLRPHDHDAYRFLDRPLWPRVLQEFVTFPTLLYHFVRRGNVEAFAELVVTATSHRNRRSRDDRD